jgi:hypothetical protein
MYAITPDGTLVSTTFQGIAISHDKACNFAFAGGPLANLVFIDLTSRPAAPGTVVAFASSYGGLDDAASPYFKSSLFETTDEAKTFTALPVKFDETLLGQTVDLAPSDPERVYVSALRNPGDTASAVLLTSTDHAKTFVENKVALISPERGLYIAAVDPNKADRVYVRTSIAVDKPSRILVSDDAGKTFRTVFTGKGSLPGFALTPDGAEIYVGGAMDGLMVANTTDFKFTQKNPMQIGCLKFDKGMLWACSNEMSGFVAGVSNDNGATFSSRLHFCQIRGPLDCPAGSTTNTKCALGADQDPPAPPWPVQRAGLGCLDQADAGADSGPNVTPPGNNTKSCGCSVPGASVGPLAALITGIAATLALLRRRR